MKSITAYILSALISLSVISFSVITDKGPFVIGPTALKVFNDNDDTLTLDEILKDRTVFLLKNHKTCMPCFDSAFKVIRKQYRNYKVYVLADYNKNRVQTLVQEKWFRKNMRVKKIYYFKNEQASPEDRLFRIATQSPTPLIISVRGDSVFQQHITLY